MDNDTKISDLKEIVKKFCEIRNWDQFHNPKDLSIGLITEASELLEMFRFQNLKQIDEMLNNPVKKESISEEISDVLFFILRLAQKYDFDLSDGFKRKMLKNDMKYPLETSKLREKK